MRPLWKTVGPALATGASLVSILTYFKIQPGEASPEPPAASWTRPSPVPTTRPPTTRPPTTRPSTTRGPTTTMPTRKVDTPMTGEGIIVWPLAGELYVRQIPRLLAPVTGSLPDGEEVVIHCTVRSDPVTGPDGATSSVWDRIDSGFVPDAFVDTGSDEPVASPCP